MVAVLSSESAENPFAGLVPYAATKAALETMMCGWRVEHPELRFTNNTVGSTGGIEFARDFDLKLAAQLLPQWIARAQIPARSMDPEELGAMIAEFLASAVAHPGVDCQQVTLRAPGGLFSGDVDQVVQPVSPTSAEAGVSSVAAVGGRPRAAR